MTDPKITVQTYGKGRYFDADGKPLSEAARAEIDARLVLLNEMIVCGLGAADYERVESADMIVETAHRGAVKRTILTRAVPVEALLRKRK